MSFRSLKRNCPVCNGARDDCRQSNLNDLIHCRADVTLAPGFCFVGQSSIGANMWAVDDGRNRNDADWEELRRQREADQERRFREEAKRFAQSLDAKERDYNIRKIHAQVGLTARHRQNLRDRGLTDTQIDEGKFFSIAPWQEVTGINPQLAGVDLYGQKLLIGQSGFACPAWNVEGQIVGWQTRVDEVKNGNKYPWPTSRGFKRPNGATAHLPSGELPITYCRPIGGVKRASIGLAEGFLKPYTAAQRQGQIVIGAAGGNFTSSPQQFKAYLDAASAETGSNTVDIYPDAGDVINNTVMIRWERVIQMVTEFGFLPRVADWGQVDKTHPDIDELPEEREISYLTPEEFLELGGRSPRSGHSFAGLLGWLPRFKRYLEKSRRESWGFGHKGEVEVEPTPPQQKTPEYDQGERINVWSSANHTVYKHALDTSDTGLGKSYDTGRLTPDMFPDARQIIYISKDHRNPTVETLKNWHDLEARHEGLYRDEFGKLRRVDKKQPYVVPPNCGRTRTIGALRKKNIPDADTADLACRTCINRETCPLGVMAYDYLHQRMEALKEQLLRAHPDSLADPDEYDYSQVVLLWEEAGETLKLCRSIEVGVDDLSRTIADLCAKLPEAFDALRPLLNTLHLHISGEIKQPNRYGLDDAQVRQALPPLGDLDLDAIKQALKPDPERFLNTTKEHGVDLPDLSRRERKLFTDRDSTTADRIAKELALNWLPDFLEVLFGNQNGSIRIQNGTLTITTRNDRLARIAQAASFNIYLDATATPEDIARAVGVEDLKQLLVVQQKAQPLDNLEVIQVAMGQRLGIGSRRQDKDGNDTFLQKRLDAGIHQIQLDNTGSNLVISDFKRYTKPGDGKRHHYVDTRGSNDLEDCDVLILVGIMCRNLNALKDEFAVLYGRPPREGTERIKYPIQINGASPDDQHYFEMDDSADPEFRAFVRRRILADIRQAIGRLRAHRRRDKQLKVYILGDYPLDFPVTLIQARDLTPDAATKTEKTEMAVLGAMQWVKAQGEKLTQEAVSEATKILDPEGKGYSQQHVSRFWNLLILLLDGSNSKMSKTNQPPPDQEEFEFMAGEYLPILAESPPGELLEGVLNTFQVYGRAVFKAIWDATPATAQIKILSVLALTLPAGELRALALALGVAF